MLQIDFFLLRHFCSALLFSAFFLYSECRHFFRPYTPCLGNSSIDVSAKPPAGSFPESVFEKDLLFGGAVWFFLQLPQKRGLFSFYILFSLFFRRLSEPAFNCGNSRPKCLLFILPAAADLNGFSLLDSCSYDTQNTL